MNNNITWETEQNARLADFVRTMCETESTDCRSLNKKGIALNLLSEVGFDADLCEIFEIPLDWSNQVCIDFRYFGRDYEVFAGVEFDAHRICLEIDELVFDKYGEIFERLPFTIEDINALNHITTVNGKPVSYKEYIEYSIANHSGKMSGIPSISTSVLCNPNCARNAAVKGSVCEKCYARGYAKIRKGLADKLKSNYEFYTSVILTAEDVPFINSAIFRFEAFGDIANERQFENYCTIAKYNPQCRFVLWTKNPIVINDYVNRGGAIPTNLYIVLSSLYLNKSPIKDIRAAQGVGYWGFVDAVFTVYDAETIEAENIDINCGGRKCLECRKCYTLEHGTIADIREKLK